jgi:hypothetical protein
LDNQPRESAGPSETSNSTWPPISAANHSPLKKSVRLHLVTEAIDHAIVQAHHLQVSPVEFQELVKARLDRFGSKLSFRQEKS